MQVLCRYYNNIIIVGGAVNLGHRRRRYSHRAKLLVRVWVCVGVWVVWSERCVLRVPNNRIDHAPPCTVCVTTTTRIITIRNCVILCACVLSYVYTYCKCVCVRVCACERAQPVRKTIIYDFLTSHIFPSGRVRMAICVFAILYISNCLL